jgi:hypothetical protein
VFTRTGTVVAVSGDYRADQVTNAVDKTVANSYTAGAKQGFQSSGVTAGMNLGGVTADPSTMAEGDTWYRTDLHAMRQFQNGVAATVGGGAGATTNQNIREISLSFDGGGVALSGTATRCREVSFGGTIQGAYIESDVSGTVVFDVLTALHSAYTGSASVTTSIAPSAKPTLTSAAAYTDETLTGWTTALTPKSSVCVAMSGPGTLTWATLTLKVAAN